MSKTLTAFLVDSSSLAKEDLGTVNSYLERVILYRVFWARKTHQIAVAIGDGTGEATLRVPFQAATNETWADWKPLERVESSTSTAYADIMDLVEQLRGHVKKLKFTKRVVWFGGMELPELQSITKSLADAGISFSAVISDAQSEPYQDLDDFCTEYDYKEVAPVCFYDGPLTLGHPGTDGFLELGVKCFPFCRKSAAPSSHAVYEASGDKIEPVSVARDKQVGGDAIEAEELSRGYSYGSETISVPPQLHEQIRQGLGAAADHGFEIIAFVPDKHPQLFTGESNIVCASDSQSQEHLATMATTMFYGEKAALARFSRRSKTVNIQLVLLEPYLVPIEAPRLLMTAIPFSEDWKRLAFGDLAKPPAQHIPGDLLIGEMDKVVEMLDVQALDYELQDFIVPNPQNDRVMAYLAELYAKRVPTVKKPRLPVSLVQETAGLEAALDLKRVVRAKVVPEQEDLLAEEQELDLDELL